MIDAAVVPLAWALLLALLTVLNWIWAGPTLQAAIFGCAALLVAGFGLAAGLRQRLSRPVGARPLASPSAVTAALGLASFVFGFAFGRFPIYFGCGLVALSLGGLAAEARGNPGAETVAAASGEPGTETVTETRGEPDPEPADRQPAGQHPEQSA